MADRLFSLPPAELYQDVDSTYVGGHATYTSYNYLGGGPVARIKLAHFEAALRLTRDRFHTTGALDFGCADGVLLPSLDRHFPRVLGVELRPEFARIAQGTVDAMELANTRVVCNEEMGFDELAEIARPYDCGVAYILETLEHVGTAERMYESKCDFVERVFGLLADEAVIAISVPTMVGPAFLLQRLVLSTLRMQRERIALRDLLAAGFLANTDRLEPGWDGDHLGFNHRKLERALRNRFSLVRKRNLAFTQVYLVTR